MDWSKSRYQVFCRLSGDIDDRLSSIVEVGRQYVDVCRGEYTFHGDTIDIKWTEYRRSCAVADHSYSIPADLLWRSHADVHAFFAKKKADADAAQRVVEEQRRVQGLARERAEFERLRVKFES